MSGASRLVVQGPRPGLLDCVFKIQDYILKVLIDKIYLNAVDPDGTATKKPPLRILIIIITVVIIIILWYNKDIWPPVWAQRGVQWFAVAMVQWSPLGSAVGSTRLSVTQLSVWSLQGWEGPNEVGSASSHWFPMGGQCKFSVGKLSDLLLLLITEPPADY